MITMGGFSLPSRTIREMIVLSIDVIVQAARLRDGSRRITHITEVLGMEGDVVITQDIFLYDISARTQNGNRSSAATLDRHRPSALLGSRALLSAKYSAEGGRQSFRCARRTCRACCATARRCGRRFRRCRAKRKRPPASSARCRSPSAVSSTSPARATSNCCGPDNRRMVIVGCALWMAVGIMSMKKMINFDI
jgi:hypothetical protein